MSHPVIFGKLRRLVSSLHTGSISYSLALHLLPLVCGSVCGQCTPLQESFLTVHEAISVVSEGIVGCMTPSWLPRGSILCPILIDCVPQPVLRWAAGSIFVIAWMQGSPDKRGDRRYR